MGERSSEARSVKQSQNFSNFSLWSQILIFDAKLRFALLASLREIHVTYKFVIIMVYIRG